jgi:hypothetical protein
VRQPELGHLRRIWVTSSSTINLFETVFFNEKYALLNGSLSVLSDFILNASLKAVLDFMDGLSIIKIFK